MIAGGGWEKGDFEALKETEDRRKES